MSKRFSLAAGLSILLHALVFFALFWRSAEPKPPPERVAVEWIERRSERTRNTGPKKGPRKIPLARLVPGWGKGQGLKPGGDFAGGAGTGGMEAEPWGSGGSQFGQIEHYNKFRQLFTHVQGLLYYPPALGRRAISGTVNSRLVFNSEGACNWKKTQISGANPYLKFYSLALLKKLCKFEAIQQIGFTDGQVADLSFAFIITEDFRTYKQDEAADRIVGNVLAFSRTYAKSILEYHIGPLQGLWLVPAVNLDFAWIFENWDKYVNGLDPLREFKDPR